MPTYTAADGAELFYTDEGEGLPVLCLAGLTRSGRDFDHLAPHLAGVRLIRPDYRGRGRSAWTGAASYTVPQEGQDALVLLDRLGIEKAAIIGTSRGGLIGFLIAAVAKPRLLGLCLNDVGPVLERGGLEAILGYIGCDPAWATLAEAAAALPAASPGFGNVPADRWAEEAARRYVETPGGLRLSYDPALREAAVAAFSGPQVDAWPFFDALAGLPVAVIRGANSDLLSPATVEEMRRRRPDLIAAEVPGRGHVPWLDEPESLAAIHAFLDACRQARTPVPLT